MIQLRALGKREVSGRKNSGMGFCRLAVFPRFSQADGVDEMIEFGGDVHFMRQTQLGYAANFEAGVLLPVLVWDFQDVP
jgi:hypothetical protein